MKYKITTEHPICETLCECFNQRGIDDCLECRECRGTFKPSKVLDKEAYLEMLKHGDVHVKNVEVIND